MNPPVREQLAGYLQKRHDTILRRLMALVQAAPDLEDVRPLAENHESQQEVSTIVGLLIRNIADPGDRQCFVYLSQRAQERLQRNVSAVQMLRVIALHRQVLHKMVSRQFAGEPSAVRRMLDIINEQFNEVELTLTTSYQSLRDQQWRLSETKYFALFENASEAILSFRPAEGNIIEANMQCVRLMGYERAALLEMSFMDLFTAEHREQAQWLVEHQPGSSNVRMEDLAVRRTDGLAVPVSLSCNWVQVDGHGGVAQVIMRDVTQLRQMQRALRDYADQLEARVAARTRELQQSQENYRTLFLQEQRRAQNLALINAIAEYSLQSIQEATKILPQAGDDDIEGFLHDTTQAIQKQFSDCDVTFYLCEKDYADLMKHRIITALQPRGTGECGDLLVAAQAGGHGLAPPPGQRHPWGAGLPGLCAQNGKLVIVERDLPRDERYLRPPGTHRDSVAQLCVPVAIENVVVGVISLQQAEGEAVFDAHDAEALGTVAEVVASHLQSSRLFREMRDLTQFHQTLTDTILHSLVITGWGEIIRVANARFCQTMRVDRHAIQGRPLDDLLGEAMARHNLRELLRDTRATGTPHELQDVAVRVRPMGQPEYGLVCDVRMFRIFFRGEPQVAVLLINITERWRREQGMRLMNETGRLFQSSLDVATVLHTVLTCITAGPALGFNRAFVFLRDDNSDMLRGARALGPSSQDEANRIWWELSRRQMSLQEILEAAPVNAPTTPLQDRVEHIELDLQNPLLPAFTATVREGHALNVPLSDLFLAPEDVFRSTQEQSVESPSPEGLPNGVSGEINHSTHNGGFLIGSGNSDSKTIALRGDKFRREYLAAKELFIARELAIAPLVSKDRVIGVVLADNLYSGAPIDAPALELLEALARQAGLAIDNARTFQALQQAQRDLLAADRLVVIGELAARISHEIRNPLATIGGWARSLQRRPDNPADVQRKAGIIMEEVSRLEGLLTDVLGMAKARPLNPEPQQINEIIDRALLLADADLRASKVEVKKSFEDLPLAMLDRSRLLQALLNIIRNGAQAMSDKPGGKIYLTTRLSEPLDSIRAAHPDAPDMIQVEVRDEGRGISEQAMRQVFDPFFSTKLRGSGLGLSVTRRIVQDHGGEISVESQPGQGTTFVLSLPLRPVPLPTQAEGEAD